jgi:hypothetical protein
MQSFQFVLPTFTANWLSTALSLPDFSALQERIIQSNTAPFAGWATWLATLPPRTQAIADILADTGITGGAEARARMVDLLANSPGDAEAYTATLIEISANGISPFFEANDSLTSTLAEALATQVAAWQAQGNSPLALAALSSVNAALAAAGIGPGTAFAIAFTARLSALGGTLPSQLSVTDVNQIVLFLQKDGTTSVSPN